MPRIGPPVVLINAPNSGPDPIVSAESHQSHPERGTLSRELIDFLIELSIALQKFAIYPAGHPMLATTVARLEQRLAALLDISDTVSLGVARNQLVIEGIATDEHHAVLRDLAQRLHDHHLGAVKIIRGVQPNELRDFLVTLGVEHGKDATPVGLLPEAELPTWSHLRLYPLAYEHLELLDEEEDASVPTAERQRGAGSGGARAARLWVGLARAALAGGGASRSRDSRPAIALDSLTEVPGSPPEGTSDESPQSSREEAEAEEHTAADPEAVARAIDEHKREAAYDQVIVGYLLQIADELRTAEGRDAVALRGRVSRLVGSMKPETLRTLLSMGNDANQRRRFVLDATQGLAVDAVLELLRAAADTSRQNISHSLIRMLSKLAAHAEQGSAQARPLADAALREQVERLLAGWELDDPNPGSYGAALQRMAAAAPVFAAPVEPAFASEDERLIQMSIEVDMLGPLVWNAVDRLAAPGDLARLFELLDGAPAGRSVVERIRERVITPAALAAALGETPVRFPLVDRLAAALGPVAADPLLDALAAAESRSLRRSLLDRLGKIGPPLGAAVVPRLGDERWYVVRNRLVLIEELAAPPAGFSAAAFLEHADPRVRRQALRLQLRSGEDRDRALVAALRDPDDATRHLALVAVQHDCPAAAAPAVVECARDPGVAADDRVLAIRALGRAGGAAALAAVLAVTDGGHTIFGRPRLAPKSPELLAALAALALTWRHDAAAAEVLGRAAQSSDAEIRAATLVPRSAP